MNWLKKLFTPAKTVSICVPVFARGMELEEFRSFEDRVGEVRRLYKTPLMTDIFGVLRQMAPRGYPLRGDNCTPIDCAIELGRKEGYSDCVDLLLAMANFAPKPEQEIAQDWGAQARMKADGYEVSQDL